MRLALSVPRSSRRSPPSLCSHSNLSWLSYGFLKGDWTLILVNAVGVTLQTLYVLVYFYFSTEKRAVLWKTLLLLMVLLLGYGYFNLLVPDVSARLVRLGLFCSIFTITMYLSPLADLIPNMPGIATSLVRFWLFWKFPPDHDRPYKLLQA
ncbi:hypothetical protein lerEdw1_003037 [Lerista edwardsae]|nr:hypothetical protein lerEdw1_003037 [Lerista edwardsae]